MVVRTPASQLPPSTRKSSSQNPIIPVVGSFPDPSGSPNAVTSGVVLTVDGPSGTPATFRLSSQPKQMLVVVSTHQLVLLWTKRVHSPPTAICAA